MQSEIINLEDLVSPDHSYRKFHKLIDFKQIEKRLKDIDTSGLSGRNGYGILQLFQCLLLQFMEDSSDRELERFLAENMAVKWFCGFQLSDKTPTYSLFTRVRKRIGTRRLSKIFSDVRDDLKRKGYMSEVFTFVDATHLISKASLWEERDKLIAQKIDKLNNEVLPKVAVDKDAKIGCKGKNKFWYGYKQHTSVDMQSGLIHKVAITPGNLTDAKGLKHVCPKSGAVYGDKGYCIKPARQTILANGCHDATIKKNNMKCKNQDLDRFHTKLRAPYERVFSKQRKRVRYRGVAKNQFTAFFQALCHNIKRMVVLQDTYVYNPS